MFELTEQIGRGGMSAGARLGPFEIVSALNAGGMGEVYRARDTALDRDVAIEVLPEAFVADPERAARFQREAKFLASVNHPRRGTRRPSGAAARPLSLLGGFRFLLGARAREDAAQAVVPLVARVLVE